MDFRIKFNMKLIVCVLALLVAAGAVPIQKDDLGVAVNHLFDKFWKALPCGIAGSGSLEPYSIEEKYTRKPFEYRDDNVK